MPFASNQSATDWLSAASRIAEQGRTSDPAQDQLSQGDPYAHWPGRSRTEAGAGDVEALPLGALEDPVSQLAAFLSPTLLNTLRQALYTSSQRTLTHSAVRDASGNLQKLYHGTDQPFSQLNARFSKPHETSYGPGAYSTTDPQAAGGYAQESAGLTGTFKPGAQIHPLYSTMPRVFDVHAPALDATALAQLNKELAKRSIAPFTAEDTPETIFRLLQYELGATETNALLQRSGYQGLTHNAEGATYGKPHRVYVDFTGKHYRSAFDVESQTQPLPTNVPGFRASPSVQDLGKRALQESIPEGTTDR